MKKSISFISSNYSFKETIKRIDETNADFLHVDLMDGNFVKNKNFTIGEINELIKKTNKKLDVHLMVQKPLKYVENFAFLNTEYLTFHLEVKENIHEIIKSIKNYGLKVGISIKPKTNLKKLNDYLNEIDLILVMSVEPGKGGQEFIPQTIERIKYLDEIRQKNNYHYIISVDGGINENNINELKENHVDMIVSGSFVCQNDNYQNQINKLN